MRRPRTEWHQEVLDDRVINTLDESIEMHSDLLNDLATRFNTTAEGETPEFVAKQIGSWLEGREDTGNDFSAPIYDDTDGNEGAAMAMGYIGVKGWELADIGVVPEG